MNISNEWVDPDDAPELGKEWLDKAAMKDNGKPVNHAGGPHGSEKERVSLRIDKDIVDRFRTAGPGGQTRINEALLRAAG